MRNILYRKGKVTELLINYEPGMQYFSEWWKQLFGESEGKDQKESTLQVQTSQQTCTHLDNTSKKDVAISSKQS